MKRAGTKVSDIINPQVMGDMIEAKIEALAKLTPYAKVDTSLQGTAGDTKTVPSWNYIGDAEDFNPEDGKEMDTTNLTATATTFTIKCAAKSVGIYQTAINSGLGDPVGQAETQLAKSIIGKVDNDVLDAAYTANNVYAASTLAGIGYDGIVDANAKFEDEEAGIEKVLFIHPKQEAALLKDDNFKSADIHIQGDTGITQGIHKGYALVLHDDLRLQKPGTHLQVQLLQNRRIAVIHRQGPPLHQLFTLLPGQLTGQLLGHTVLLPLQLQADAAGVPIIDTDTELLSGICSDLIFIVITVIVIIKIQAADPVLSVRPHMTIQGNQIPNPVFQKRHLRGCHHIL